MQTSEDMTNIVARVASEIGVQAVKSSGNIVGGAVNVILESLLKKLSEKNKNIHPGRTNLNKLIKSGNDLKMTDINQNDIKMFTAKAKKFGLVFAVIKNKDSRFVIYRSDDIERVKKVLELAFAEKLIKKEKDQQENENKNKEISKVKNIDNKIEKKLSKEQMPTDNKSTDLPNNSIDVKAHESTNKSNKTIKKAKENKQSRESVMSKINRIEKSRTTVIQKPNLTKFKGRGR